MKAISNIINTASGAEIILTLVCVFLFLYVFQQKIKLKNIKMFANIYAGGVQRMTSYLQKHDMYEDYRNWSAAVYGSTKEGKNEKRTN